MPHYPILEFKCSAAFYVLNLAVDNMIQKAQQLLS